MGGPLGEMVDACIPVGWFSMLLIAHKLMMLSAKSLPYEARGSVQP